MRANIQIKQNRVRKIVGSRKKPQKTQPAANYTTGIEEQIRKTAYEIAEKRGFVPGYELDDWFEAERQVKARLKNVKDLLGYRIHATDGDIGHVEDFYFDDENWKVRYAVVNCGSWLGEKKVLISPEALRHIDWIGRHFYVNLTKDQVRHSPDIDTHKPISRQEEAKLFTYYNWPMYWPPSFVAESAITAEQQEGPENEPESHLQSIKEVKKYSIEAVDGAIGHVEDFVVEDDTWTLRYTVVDTKKWLPGRTVLVATSWINKISWKDSAVSVALTKEEIKHSPQMNEVMPINREFEERLHDHYKKPKYWE
jgi:hypothetical protein